MPALHFRWYLGGCLVRVREGKGWEKSNMKVQYKRCWQRNAGLCPGMDYGREILWETLFFGALEEAAEWVRKRKKLISRTGSQAGNRFLQVWGWREEASFPLPISRPFTLPPLPVQTSRSTCVSPPPLRPPSTDFLWPLGSVWDCSLPPSRPPKGAVCHSAWSPRKRGERGLIELI